MSNHTHASHATSNPHGIPPPVRRFKSKAHARLDLSALSSACRIFSLELLSRLSLGLLNLPKFSLKLLSPLSLGLLNLPNIFLKLLSPLSLGFLSCLNPSFSLLNISLAVLVP